MTGQRDLTALRVAAIVAAAVVSFESVSTLAADRGWSTVSAVAMPLAVDIGLLVAIRSRSLWLILPAVAINGAANLIAHARDDVSAFLSLIPVAILLIAELAGRAKPPVRPSKPLRGAPSAPTSWLPPEAFSEALRAASGQEPVANRMAAIVASADSPAKRQTTKLATAKSAYDALSADGHAVTAADMAGHLGLSARSGRRYLAMARGET